MGLLARHGAWASDAMTLLGRQHEYLPVAIPVTASGYPESGETSAPPATAEVAGSEGKRERDEARSGAGAASLVPEVDADAPPLPDIEGGDGDAGARAAT